MMDAYMSPLRVAEVLGISDKVVMKRLGKECPVAFYVTQHGGRRKSAVISEEGLNTFRRWLILHRKDWPSRTAEVK